MHDYSLFLLSHETGTWLLFLEIVHHSFEMKPDLVKLGFVRSINQCGGCLV